MSYLKQTGCTHATANTHGHHHILDATAFTFNQGVSYQTCACHAIGVTNRDAATVDVVDIGVDAQLIAAVNGLAGKRLIQFPQANVVNL